MQSCVESLLRRQLGIYSQQNRVKGISGWKIPRRTNIIKYGGILAKSALFLLNGRTRTETSKVGDERLDQLSGWGK